MKLRHLTNSFPKRLMLSAMLMATSLAVISIARADDELLEMLGGAKATTTKSNEPSAIRKLLTVGNSGQAPSGSSSGWASRAVNTNVVPEQNVFLESFEKADYAKALSQWPAAVDQTPFAQTASAKALHAFLLYKNGLKVVGLETLLAVEKPEEISPDIMTLWKEAAPDTDPTWSLVRSEKWSPYFTGQFGVAAEIRVRSRDVYNEAQVETLKELIKKTQIDSSDRAWLQWQIVLALSTGDDAGTAGKALALLMKGPNNPVGQDLMTMTAARLLYQNGFIDAAIKYYQKVPKSSDEWFDAQEEISWSYIRKNEPQNSIALTKTLIQPEFASMVGPEALFVRALSQLKVCDYPEVASTLKIFRDHFQKRAKALIELTENASSPQVKRYVDRSKTARLKLTDLGQDSNLLPRFITRDEVLAQLIRTQSALESESAHANAIIATNMAGAVSRNSGQAEMGQLKQGIDARIQTARAAAYNEIKADAQSEINEISETLQKMHIVEAEVLQQISISSKMIQASIGAPIETKSGSTGSQGRDRISFPAEKETWFDELANYQVDIKKGCQSAKR